MMGMLQAAISYSLHTSGGIFMYYFIINPNSRSGKGAEIWKQLQNILDRKKVSYKAYFTSYRGHAVSISEKITSQAGSPVNLIAVGGDGTIQEVLTGIKDLSSVRFGYIPTGSGNDFCRSMKLPQDPAEALDIILSGHKISDIDIPFITYKNDRSRFAISCGIGFDAAVCHEVGITPMKKVLNKIGLGKLVYLFVALKQLLFLTPSPVTLDMDGRNESFSKVYFVAVMNQKYEGGGFKFCPKASPSDGILDVIVVDSLPKFKVLLCLPTAFFGKHTIFKGIHIFQCKNITVNSEVALPVHKDGESGGIHKSFSVSVEPQKLSIFLPQ